MNDHMRNSTRRTLAGALAVAVAGVALQAQAYQVPADCVLCSSNGGIIVSGSNIGMCGDLPQDIGVIGGGHNPPRYWYKESSNNLTCYKEDNNGDLIPCDDLRLCCNQGWVGYFACETVWDSETCESFDRCAGKCCPAGAMLEEVPVPGCPGAMSRFLECNE